MFVKKIVSVIVIAPGYATADGGWKVERTNISFCGYDDLKTLDSLEQCLKKYQCCITKLSWQA